MPAIGVQRQYVELVLEGSSGFVWYDMRILPIHNLDKKSLTAFAPCAHRRGGLYKFRDGTESRSTRGKAYNRPHGPVNRSAPKIKILSIRHWTLVAKAPSNVARSWICVSASFPTDATRFSEACWVKLNHRKPRYSPIRKNAALRLTETILNVGVPGMRPENKGNHSCSDAVVFSAARLAAATQPEPCKLCAY